MNSHCEDQIILRPSYDLDNEIFYTGKVTSLLLFTRLRQVLNGHFC